MGPSTIGSLCRRRATALATQAIAATAQRTPTIDGRLAPARAGPTEASPAATAPHWANLTVRRGTSPPIFRPHVPSRSHAICRYPATSPIAAAGTRSPSGGGDPLVIPAAEDATT